MNIDRYTNMKRISGAREKSAVLGFAGQSDEIVLKKPFNPPGKWLKFKAALGKLPVLCKLGSLRHARARCAAYPVRLQNYNLTNRKILAGFVNDLHNAYGSEIADMTMRDRNFPANVPLAGRVVADILHQAAAAKQNFVSINNQHITSFLDNPPHSWRNDADEQDMGDIFFRSSGRSATVHDSWKRMLSVEEESFIAGQIIGRCRDLPQYSQRQLTNQEIAGVAKTVLGFYHELRDAPGLTSQRRAEILFIAIATPDHVAAKKSAREQAVMDSVEAALKRTDPKSMLKTIAAKLAKTYAMPEPSDAVLKSVSNGMAEFLRYKISGLANEFGCGEDIASLVGAVLPRLSVNVEKALDEHYLALKGIAASWTLESEEKRILLDLGSKVRLDPVQTAQYEAGAEKMVSALTLLKRDLPVDPGLLVTALSEVSQACETGIAAMARNAVPIWMSTTLEGTDLHIDMTETMALMAASRLSVKDATSLSSLLTGPSSRQLMQGLNKAVDMELRGAPILLNILTQAVGQRVGKTRDAAIAAADALGDEIPFADLPPDLILRILTSNASNTIDERSVLEGAWNGNEIAADFRSENIMLEHRDTILGYITSDKVDTQYQLAASMVKDAGRAAFNLNGISLGKTGTNKNLVLQVFRSQFPQGREGDDMALAVSRCMSQEGIKSYLAAAQEQAFGPTAVSAAKSGQTQHDAWKQDDGSWLVRSIHTNSPAMISRGESTSTFDNDGVALYSLSYRVGPDKMKDGHPVIRIVDSMALFNF